MRRKKLAIIDGKSVLYRGYYAMSHLSNSQGKSTGATYGFAMMGLRVLNDIEPDYVIVAWDKSKTNTRSRRELYPEYKANRKPMPEDLREQIPDVRKLCEAFSWPFLEIDDYEADDIMGTLREQAKDQDIDVILVTSDLDVLQLVNGHTNVLALKKGLSQTVLYDEKRLRDEYNMTPEQFIDYKALRGDPSDNIPGVAGVGEKTARQLIEDFDSLDGVYEHLDELRASLRTKLEQDKDMAYLSKKLVEIVCDIGVQLDLEAAKVEDSHPNEIQQIFSDLNFRRLQNELPSWMRPQPQPGLFSAPEDREVKPDIKTPTIEERIEPIKEDTAVVLTLGEQALVSPDAQHAYLVPIDGVEVERIIGFHTKEDIKRLQYKPSVAFDIMIAAFVLNPLLRQQTLAALANDVFSITINDINRSDDVERTTMEKQVAILWKLYDHYCKELESLPELTRVLEDIEWPLLPVIAAIETRGMKLDVAYLKKMSQDFAERISTIEEQIYQEAGREFNINSPQQLQTVLFDDLGLPTEGIKKTKTGYSTGAGELDKLHHQHPIVEWILRYRELAKLKSTYIDALPKLVDSNDRLHTTLTQTVAQTGRLSSVNPNLQNIPVRSEEGRAIRRAFIAEKDHLLISADYSQFELRLAAALSGDKQMLATFNEGGDIHTQTAAELHGIDASQVNKEQRYSAKAVNFGVLYGMSPHGLSVAAGMTREEAKRFIDTYFQIRPQLYEYLENLKQQAREKGYVETFFGRRRPMPDIKSSNYMVRSAAERAAMNMPIQGTEADIMKLAMIEAEKQLADDCPQIMQVHDSIIVEAPMAEAETVADLLREVMYSTPPDLGVELMVDTEIGPTWAEV